MTSPPDADRPNVVVIYTDDQGYGDVSSLNPNAKFETPTFDRLADEGMSFTDAHCPDTICTPSRYGLLTGRYCWRTSRKQGVMGAEGECLIDTDRLTLPGLFHEHGYRTAVIGKWHLGMQFPGSKGDRDWSKPVIEGPLDRDFDRFYGVPASMNFGVLAWFDGRYPETPPTKWTRKKDNDIAINDYRITPPYDDDPIYKDDLEVAPNFDDQEALTRFTNEAIAWLDDVASGSKDRDPFFLYVPYTSPHKPVIPRDRFRGVGEAGAYGAFMRETDWQIDRILGKLDAEGIADETIVIVTSDNGPFRVCRERYRRYDHDSTGGYRGRKAHLYEGGHRIPFLVRWPGVVEPGSTCEETICQTDLLATFADILGYDLPADAGEDSESILAALRGETLDGAVRGPVVHHSGSGYFAIRDGRWKLNFGRGPQGDKEPAPEEPPFELYDLRSDTGETENVYNSHPEIVDDLIEKMEDIVKQGRSTPGPSQSNEGSFPWVGLEWMT